VSSSPYVTEVAYVRQFCGELSPTLLRAAAGLGGFQVEDRDDFDYCELGSGLGDTTCTLAAAYPRARFVGVDFNRAHVTFAREMAHRGGLENVRFLERDFADLEGEPLPELDFVCAHGVLAWIAPDKQRALIALAASKLKPGGVLYVSYNALPGWASVQPLRRLLTDAAGTAGSSLDRARRAVDLARTLRDGGAQYFASNPAAGEMVATMDRVGPGYTVHEYMQEHWRPMYFADLAAEMAAAGLRFAGELPLYRNVPRLTIPAGLGAFFEAPRDRIEAEHLKDFATNNFFRADVYVKTTQPPDPAVASELLDGTRLGTLVTVDKVRRDARLAHHEIHTQGEPFDSLLAALCERPATLREIAGRGALAQFSIERLREAVVDLLAGEQITPMAPASNAAHVAARYNRAVLEQPLSETHPVVLASPVAGTGIAVPGLQAVCLRLLMLVDPPDRAAWIRAFVARQPVRLHVADRPVSDPEEQAKVIAAELERFKAQRLPKLRALGVVDAS
jgi:SAM-dependent methyltransferase